MVNDSPIDLPKILDIDIMIPIDPHLFAPYPHGSLPNDGAPSNWPWLRMAWRTRRSSEQLRRAVILAGARYGMTGGHGFYDGIYGDISECS